MKYKRLESSRLLLRKFHKDDLDFLFHHFNNEFVSKYLFDNEPPQNVDEATRILDWCLDIESIDHIRWCIVLKEENLPIGTAGFHRYDQANNSAEIGYDLCEKYTLQGYMTEALQCMLNYGFDSYNLHRIQASIALNNVASYKLLGKLGFQREGLIRDQYLFRGNYYDHYLFSLLKSEKSIIASLSRKTC